MTPEILRTHLIYDHRGVSLNIRGDMDLSAGTERHSLVKAASAEAYANAQELAALESLLAFTSEHYLGALGVAEANRIVADGLGGPEGYLRYLHIESLKEARAQGAQVIYVPTEAGLPILEASRLKPQQ